MSNKHSKAYPLFILLLAITLSACGGGSATDDPNAGGGGGPTPTPGDDDGDGLQNTEETSGWEIIVDANGFGLLADASLLERRMVTSDPDLFDTDNDGLSDGEEYIARTDPRRADTDGDGLTDLQEVVRWNTDANSADSDGDARDPNGTRSPDSSFFDGAEVTAGTSPSQADTDGDGVSDFDEFEQSRNAVIAEIPQVDIAVTSAIAMTMNIEYSETTGSTTEYGSVFSTSNTSTQSRSDTESTAITHAASSGGEGFFDDLEFSKQGAIKFFGGKLLELGRSSACEFGETGNINAAGLVQFDTTDRGLLGGLVSKIADGARSIFNPVADSVGLCDEPTPEITNSTSTTLTSESSRTATEEYSRYQIDSQEKTESASSGTISLSIQVTNRSQETIKLVDPQLTMMQWQSNPDISDAFGSGTFQTLATLTVPSTSTNTFVLAQNNSVTVQLQNDNVNTDFIKRFLARPEAIFFSPASFSYTDDEDVDLRFVHQNVFNRTAIVVIDDGQTAIQRYQVSTNVDRTEEGDFAGLRVDHLLTNVLEKTYTTVNAERSEDGGTTLVQVAELDSLHGLGTVVPTVLPDPSFENGAIGGSVGDPQRRWVVYLSDPDTNTTLTDFEDLVLNSGDELRLVYIRDDDGDGLFLREENLYGTSDDPNDVNATDFDNDGLTDAFEVKTGWTVTIDYLNGSGANDSVSYRVTSSPTESDADEDGLSDSEEKLLGTDPYNRDTDDDTLADGCEVNPTDPDNTVTNNASLPSCNYAFAYVIRQGSSVDLYQVDGGDGSLTSVDNPIQGIGGTSAPGINPQAIAIDPRGRYAYIANGSSNAPYRISSYTMEPGTGILTALANAFQYPDNFSGLENWSWVSVDPTGTFLFSTDTGPDSDSTDSFRISDGSDAGETAGQILHLDDDNGSYRANPDKVVFHPDGDLVIISGNSDFIAVASIETDPGSANFGVFTEIASTPSSNGFDMIDFVNDMTVSANGKYLYVSTRRSGSSPRIRVFEITQVATATLSRGHLTQIQTFTLPGEVPGLVLSPDGQFLFGGDTTNDQILAWSIDSSTGLLSNVDRLPGTPSVHDGYATAANPDTLAIHPSGRVLYVGADDGVFIHDVNTTTGAVSIFDAVTDIPVGGTDPDQIVIHRAN